MTFFEMMPPELIENSEKYRHPLYPEFYVDANGHIFCDGEKGYRFTITSAKAGFGFRVVNIRMPNSSKAVTNTEVFKFTWECFHQELANSGISRCLPKDMNFYNRRPENIIKIETGCKYRKVFADFKKATAERAIEKIEEQFGAVDKSPEAIAFYDHWFHLIGITKEFRKVIIKKIQSL